jgi:hypothetical protein
MIAVIKPTQFSALKVLNPFDDEDERGEDDERQADVEQIPHCCCLLGSFPLLGNLCVPGSSKPLVSPGASGPDGSYAGGRAFLTDSMHLVNPALVSTVAWLSPAAG